MELMEAIKKRYSCRSYQGRPVEAEKLNQILEAARLAPSARNLQDWRFVVVTDADKRKALEGATANQKFVGQAPVVLVACSETARRMNCCGQPYSSIDVSIALEHIALAATALGLGTCWIGSFYPYKVRTILNIPSHIEVVQLMTLGYPADTPTERNRLPIEQIVCRERWIFR